MSNNFDKSERLSSRKQMEILFEKGRGKTIHPLKVIYLHNSGPSSAKIQAMFVVPKRKFKKAHDRNKLRRRTREAYRLSKFAFYEALGDKLELDIAFLYISSKQENYQVINASLKGLLTFLTQEITLKRASKSKNQ